MAKRDFSQFSWFFFNPTQTPHLFDFQIIVCFQSFLVFYIN